jgi:hypothetical protein
MIKRSGDVNTSYDIRSNVLFKRPNANQNAGWNRKQVNTSGNLLTSLRKIQIVQRFWMVWWCKSYIVVRVFVNRYTFCL